MNNNTYASQLTSKISGHATNPSAPATESSFTLPATKLLYAHNTILRTQGPIDYLIIGSGPAESVIAHELVLQKPESHVVLIDSDL